MESTLCLDRGQRFGLLGNALTRTSGLGLAGLDIGSVLLGRTTTASGFLGVTIVAADAHVALAVTSESILASKTSTTAAGERLLASVGLQVALEIVASDERLVANIALVGAIIEMGLDMGLDVLLATEASVLAILPQTHPFAVLGIGAGDVLVDLIAGDTGLTNGRLHTSIQVIFIDWLGVQFRPSSHERGLDRVGTVLTTSQRGSLRVIRKTARAWRGHGGEFGEGARGRFSRGRDMMLELHRTSQRDTLERLRSLHVRTDRGSRNGKALGLDGGLIGAVGGKIKGSLHRGGLGGKWRRVWHTVSVDNYGVD